MMKPAIPFIHGYKINPVKEAPGKRVLGLGFFSSARPRLTVKDSTLLSCQFLEILLICNQGTAG
jgi:hypothetical protein